MFLIKTLTLSIKLINLFPFSICFSTNYPYSLKKASFDEKPVFLTTLQNYLL